MTGTIARAVELARGVRAKILSDRTSGSQLRSRHSRLVGQCGLASIRLAVELGDPGSLRLGFFMQQSTFMGKRGRYPNCHAWNAIGDRIVDITATQFGRYPAIYVVPAKDALPYLETANGAQALEEMVNEWRIDCIDDYAEPLRRFRSLTKKRRAA